LAGDVRVGKADKRAAFPCQPIRDLQGSAHPPRK
jgi:hypothetical protein